MNKWTRRAFVTTGVITGGVLAIGVGIRPGKRTRKVADFIANENESVLNVWLKISPDNTVTAIVPHAEMGHGTGQNRDPDSRSESGFKASNPDSSFRIRIRIPNQSSTLNPLWIGGPIAAAAVGAVGFVTSGRMQDSSPPESPGGAGSM